MSQPMRRVASGSWEFEHHPYERSAHNEWWSMGGPDHDPNKHAVSYTVPEKGKVDFHGVKGFNELEQVRREHGDDDADRIRDAVLSHHEATEVNHAPPPKPHKSQPKVYYHGTHVGGVTHILPANHHGNPVLYDETDSHYAYATPNLDDAWNYAMDAATTAKERGHSQTRPRVYATSPIGGHRHVEVDPNVDPETGHPRYTNPDDKRSKKGFKVVKEMKAPPHVRKSYTDEDWGRD